MFSCCFGGGNLPKEVLVEDAPEVKAKEVEGGKNAEEKEEVAVDARDIAPAAVVALVEDKVAGAADEKVADGEQVVDAGKEADAVQELAEESSATAELSLLPVQKIEEDAEDSLYVSQLVELDIPTEEKAQEASKHDGEAEMDVEPLVGKGDDANVSMVPQEPMSFDAPVTETEPAPIDPAPCEPLVAEEVTEVAAIIAPVTPATEVSETIEVSQPLESTPVTEPIVETAPIPTIIPSQETVEEPKDASTVQAETTEPGVAGSVAVAAMTEVLATHSATEPVAEVAETKTAAEPVTQSVEEAVAPLVNVPAVTPSVEEVVVAPVAIPDTTPEPEEVEAAPVAVPESAPMVEENVVLPAVVPEATPVTEAVAVAPMGIPEASPADTTVETVVDAPKAEANPQPEVLDSPPPPQAPQDVIPEPVAKEPEALTTEASKEIEPEAVIEAPIPVIVGLDTKEKTDDKELKVTENESIPPVVPAEEQVQVVNTVEAIDQSSKAAVTEPEVDAGPPAVVDTSSSEPIEPVAPVTTQSESVDVPVDTPAIENPEVSETKDSMPVKENPVAEEVPLQMTGAPVEVEPAATAGEPQEEPMSSTDKESDNAENGGDVNDTHEVSEELVDNPVGGGTASAGGPGQPHGSRSMNKSRKNRSRKKKSNSMKQ